MPDLRAMLLARKVPPYLVDIAIPYMFFTPGESDPDSAAAIEIIKGVQNGLQTAGFKVSTTGAVDSKTAKAMNKTSPGWMQKSWVQIYGDVQSAIDNPAKVVSSQPRKALGSYFDYQGVPPGPLPGYKVGLPPGPLGMGTTAMDAGVSLDFGQGVRDKTVLVPIPQSSGPTYTIFKDLQRQINRVLSKVGTRVSEDGILGKGTLAGLKKAQTIIGKSLPGTSSTLDMAEHAVTLGFLLHQAADAMGISKTANQGMVATAQAAVETTQGPLTPEQRKEHGSSGIFDTLKTYAPYLAIAGGVAWFAAKQKKGKRR